MSRTVSDPPFLRFAENTIPTAEKRRSTEAEDAGQPRYWRAITSKLGNLTRCLSHQISWRPSVLLRRVVNLRQRQIVGQVNSSLTTAAASSSSSSLSLVRVREESRSRHLLPLACSTMVLAAAEVLPGRRAQVTRHVSLSSAGAENLLL